MTVLVIDDDGEAAALIADGLREPGHLPASAPGGCDGQRLAREPAAPRRAVRGPGSAPRASDA